MPTRPDLKKALGRDAVYGDSPATATAASRRPGRPKKTDGPTWEQRTERVTFHFPIELHGAVKEEAVRSGRTKSGVVADAVREHLERVAKPATRARRTAAK